MDKWLFKMKNHGLLLEVENNFEESMGIPDQIPDTTPTNFTNPSGLLD